MKLYMLVGSQYFAGQKMIDHIFYDADRALKDATLEMLEPASMAMALDCGRGIAYLPKR